MWREPVPRETGGVLQATGEGRRGGDRFARGATRGLVDDLCVVITSWVRSVRGSLRCGGSDRWVAADSDVGGLRSLSARGIARFTWNVSRMLHGRRAWPRSAPDSDFPQQDGSYVPTGPHWVGPTCRTTGLRMPESTTTPDAGTSISERGSRRALSRKHGCGRGGRSGCVPRDIGPARR